MSADGEYSLLLADDGTVFSFGWSGNGRTGLGTEIGNTLIATPIDMTNLAGVTIEQVSASGANTTTGGAHSLLLASNGSVYSFGKNQYGRTGLGAGTGNTLIATPINMINLAGLRVIQVSGGLQHSLLLAVPEPSGVTLVLLAGLSLLVGGRFR